ncbi:MAG TPA: hypothetical protein VFG30_37345 [Polyangiales bacterium]|nr:hypothetical protein [Polyangiales bacterium]
MSAAVLACAAVAPAAQAQRLYYEQSDPLTDAEAAEMNERAYARELPMWTIGYSMSLGVGDLNDYIGSPSFRGFEITLLWPAVRSFFAGLAFGYNGFYETSGRQTFQLQSAAVTGKLYRYADAWPLALLGRYVFMQRQSVVRPYVGLRMGMAWINTTTLVTDRTFEDSSLGFLLAPEAGILGHLSKSVMACLSYTFNFTTASPGDRDVLSYSSLLLGLTLQP